MVPDLNFDFLVGSDVEITGRWLEGPTRDWRGVATSMEPIVAVTFLASASGVEWCKSEGPKSSGQPVRLLLGHYDSQGLDVQVNFSVGECGCRTRTTVGSGEYRPIVEAHTIAQSGRMFLFAEVLGSRPVALGAVFIRRSDVRIGRNGLWRVRPEHARRLPPQLEHLLTRGRTGTLAAG